MLHIKMHVRFYEFVFLSFNILKPLYAPYLYNFRGIVALVVVESLVGFMGKRNEIW